MAVAAPRWCPPFCPSIQEHGHADENTATSGRHKNRNVSIDVIAATCPHFRARTDVTLDDDGAPVRRADGHRVAAPGLSPALLPALVVLVAVTSSAGDDGGASLQGSTLVLCPREVPCQPRGLSPEPDPLGVGVRHRTATARAAQCFAQQDPVITTGR